MNDRCAPFFGWPGWQHLRLSARLGAFGAVWWLAIYGGADALTAHRASLLRVNFDWEQHIPFIPETVVFYLSIHLLFAIVPFVLRDARRLRAFAWTSNAIILIAGICFLLVPARLGFQDPPVANAGIFAALFRFVDRMNLTFNLIPSLHVALSVACVAALALHAPRKGKLALGVWAAAIAASTLLTHQHHILDALTGAVLGWTAFKLIYLRRLDAPGHQASRPA